MIVYFIVLLILIGLSYCKISKRTTHVIMFLLMLFLCFGYMTGSDWRNYEDYYVNGFVDRLVEPGYILISETFSSIGVNFWSFHILFKLLSFAAIVSLIEHLHTENNIFFAIALWYASFGLFLFINCPFRNMIACGISAIGFFFYLNKNWWLYYLCAFVAMTFHLSAIILLVIPLFQFTKIRSRYLIIIYFLLLLILGFGGNNFLKHIFDSLLPSFLADRINVYDDMSSGSIFSIGLVPRLICLFLIIKYRNNIVAKYKYGTAIINLTYLYLICCLIYYVMPMLFRSALFLSPFYVTSIALGIKEITISNRNILKVVYSFITAAIVFTTVKSVYFVPYTNIITNIISNEYYNYTYRDSYNFINSPFTKK